MDCSTFAFDLHVLGTPPALILSQDQTLMLIRCLYKNRPEGRPLRGQLLTRAPVDLALALFVCRCVSSASLPCGSFSEQADTRRVLRVLARTI